MKIVRGLQETDTHGALRDAEWQKNALLIREYELFNYVTSFYENNKEMDSFKADNLIADEVFIINIKRNKDLIFNSFENWQLPTWKEWLLNSC